MNYNFQKICQDLLKDLPSRAKEVVSRRFALSGKSAQKEGFKGETLEEIGGRFGITRERVRQIEEAGLEKIRPEIKKYQKVFQEFFDYFNEQGGVKRETALLKDLGGEKNQPQVYFLLSLDKRFERISESDDFYTFWTTDKNRVALSKKTIDLLHDKLEEIKKPLSFREIKLLQTAGDKEINSYLEISKRIQKNKEDLFGLKEWPEINPRGIKDKAYLIFKKVKAPLHFTKVSELINGSLAQTVHNELIRDSRFVLVGRGIYALSEWGYVPGQVKDVITMVLKESKAPLTRDEVLSQVLKQRMVKENTVLLNLSNKNYFSKNSQGKYTVREI